MDRIPWPQTGGWYGMIILLAMQFATSFGYVSFSNPLYQILELTAGLDIMFASRRKGLSSMVVLNAIWSVVALAALHRIFFHH